jgi:transposase
MKQYSADFRDRLVRAIDAGLAGAEAARHFGVDGSTIRRWQQRRRQTGSAAPAPRSGRRPWIGSAEAPALAVQVADHPDAILAAHCARWAATTGIHVSEATMCRTLARFGLTLKKRP